MGKNASEKSLFLKERYCSCLLLALCPGVFSTFNVAWTSSISPLQDILSVDPSLLTIEKGGHSVPTEGVPAQHNVYGLGIFLEVQYLFFLAQMNPMYKESHLS